MTLTKYNFAWISSVFLVTALYSSNSYAACKQGVTSDKTNTCIGSDTLYKNYSGMNNNAFGYGALYENYNGRENVAFGSYALNYNTTGSLNVAVGNSTLFDNTTASRNTAVGSWALSDNTTGEKNTATGAGALQKNTTGYNNTADGAGALLSNTTGYFNAASGSGALYNATTGNNNSALGYRAGAKLTTGSNNIMIGANVIGSSSTDSTIMVGLQGTQTQTFIAGISGTTVTGAATVVIDTNGQLGTLASSRRYKEDIHAMGDTSNRLTQLRPVTFRYKKPDGNGQKPLQIGLIAEEVAAVMPELVVYNKDGSPETVAYQLLPSLLLNEYQKQARELASEKAELAVTKSKLEELEAEMAAMKLTLSKLASAQSGHTQLAAAP